MTESLEVLGQLADQCILNDAEEKAWMYHYDDEDIMNACIVFYHILGNRFAHDKTKSTDALALSTSEAEECANRIHDIVFDMTGIDTRKYYKGVEK